MGDVRRGVRPHRAWRRALIGRSRRHPARPARDPTPRAIRRPRRVPARRRPPPARLRRPRCGPARTPEGPARIARARPRSTSLQGDARGERMPRPSRARTPPCRPAPPSPPVSRPHRTPPAARAPLARGGREPRPPRGGVGEPRGASGARHGVDRLAPRRAESSAGARTTRVTTSIASGSDGPARPGTTGARSRRASPRASRR